MPGFFGWLNPDGTVPSPAGVASRETKTRGDANLVYGDDLLQLGLHERPHGPTVGDVCRTDDGVVGLYGHCFDRRAGARLDATAFAEAWRRDGDELLDRLEGAFHFLVWQRESRRLQVGNDRIGILPLYWHAGDGIFSFGPRMRLLARRGASWNPAPGAVLNFLSVGHFLGPSTQTSEASFLTPATILDVGADTLEVAQRRYWNLVYNPDHGTSTAEHRRRLGEAIQESVALMTGPECGKRGIFLSGGWDSRSILGATLDLERPPHLVITNGVSDEILLADTWLAKKMAGDLGLPYRFCRRDPEVGRELCLDGVHSGEITTANNPESFGQHRLDPEVFAEIDYILKGDVTWGSGDRAPTHDLSIGKIVPYPLMDKVKTVVDPEVAGRADDLYEQEIDGVMRHCENTDWTERRDYLWQMGGINRYILGLGISDEEHVQVRRPLLAGRVFDAYTRVPENLRVLKNLFIESIKDRYPRVFAYGRNHASNIANYYAFMAPFVRERTLAHLDAGHDLGGLLVRERCRQVVEAFRPVDSPIWIPGWKQRLYDRMHDRYSHLWHRTRFYDEKHVKKFETSDTMLAFHIYLLLEWFHGAELDGTGSA
ncbi:MAG: hypothetical protein GY838_00865 [bacterium]|nr:hypothetical protein [bacterium]